jgi:transcriptional regulator with XRE-family HTH domain
MQTELKKQIASGAAAYAKEKKLSNNDVARLTGVNAGYVSQIFNGKFENEVNGKPTPIGDTHFHKLAIWAGVLTKKTYWHIEPTRQFQEIITTLEECKQEGTTAMVIAATGIGKTHAIDAFVKKHPLHTYRITVNSLYKLTDVINELADKLGVDVQHVTGKRVADYSLKIRMDKIAAKLIEIKHAGGEPILIIDEGENMEISLLKMTKGLFDIIKGLCSIVLFGTPKLVTNMLNTTGRNRNSIPELYRRFKAGQKNITAINKAQDFAPFFTKYKIEKGLQKLLCILCENYGELYDYLQPTLKECDEKDMQLTEDFFRIKWNITAYKN